MKPTNLQNGCNTIDAHQQISKVEAKRSNMKQMDAKQHRWMQNNRNETLFKRTRASSPTTSGTGASLEAISSRPPSRTGTILYYTILYYTILYYTILYYTILYYTTLHYTTLQYTIYNIQYTIYYIQYTIYYIQYTIYCILHTTYNILYYILYTILHTIYCILCTIYYTILGSRSAPPRRRGAMTSWNARCRRTLV